MVEHLQVHVGDDVDLREPEGHRTAGPTADVAVHANLITGEHAFRVIAAAQLGGTFEDAAVPAERVGKSQELILGSMRAGHVAAVGHPVQEGAGGREAERPGGQRLVDHGHHGGDVLSGGRILVERPLAHRRYPDGTVADHATDVEPLGQRSQIGQVLAVGFPVPGEAVEDALGGNVLDRLHHLGEELPTVRCDRGKGDAAVAQHDRGDAVPARRTAQRVPGQLGIEVGVDVDEAGRDDQPVGVQLPPGGAFHPSDLDHAVAVDRHIGGRRRYTGAIDDGSSSDHQVIRHGKLLGR